MLLGIEDVSVLLCCCAAVLLCQVLVAVTKKVDLDL